MTIKIHDSFDKDIQRINNKSVNHQLTVVIASVIQTTTLKEIVNIKKLKGYKHYYRIHMGNYRIGLCIAENTVEFVRCLHRKDIYKKFP